MAIQGGEWIPMTVGLAKREEVIRISEATEEPPLMVVGRLAEFWGWWTLETLDGRTNVRTLSGLSAATSTSEVFLQAMLDVGWLERVEEGGFFIPKWNRFFSKTAKARLGERFRKREQRLFIPPPGQTSGQNPDSCPDKPPDKCPDKTRTSVRLLHQRVRRTPLPPENAESVSRGGPEFSLSRETAPLAREGASEGDPAPLVEGPPADATAGELGPSPGEASGTTDPGPADPPGPPPVDPEVVVDLTGRFRFSIGEARTLAERQAWSAEDLVAWGAILEKPRKGVRDPVAYVKKLMRDFRTPADAGLNGHEVEDLEPRRRRALGMIARAGGRAVVLGNGQRWDLVAGVPFGYGPHGYRPLAGVEVDVLEQIAAAVEDSLHRDGIVAERASMEFTA